MNKGFSTYTAFLAIVLLFSAATAHGFTNKKVILLATRDGQGDSLGYNFVNDFAGAAYQWLSDGKVQFWDSPEKKTILNISDLKGIEKNSNASFTRLSNLFIYENWTSRARKFSFTVKGFSFTGINAKGEEVLFGYVESNASVKELLKNSPLHVNANGNYNMTLFAALMNMGFQYNLVFFDDTPLKDYKNSARIVKKAINPKKKMLNFVRLPQTKLVEYGWDSTDLSQSKISDELTKVVGDFFNTNRQEFYNYGGDKYYSYLKNRKLLITGLHVIQEWTKDKKGNITCKLIAVVPYTVGFPLQQVPAQKLEEWGLKYKETSLTETLNTRNFSYSIKKINETQIPYVMADWVKANLTTGDWGHIISNNIHIN
jgi:hypothetical protein